jgi:hypothetical protein
MLKTYFHSKNKINNFYNTSFHKVCVMLKGFHFLNFGFKIVLISCTHFYKSWHCQKKHLNMLAFHNNLLDHLLNMFFLNIITSRTKIHIHFYLLIQSNYMLNNFMIHFVFLYMNNIKKCNNWSIWWCLDP